MTQKSYSFVCRTIFIDMIYVIYSLRTYCVNILSITTYHIDNFECELFRLICDSLDFEIFAICPCLHFQVIFVAVILKILLSSCLFRSSKIKTIRNLVNLSVEAIKDEKQIYIPIL